MCVHACVFVSMLRASIIILKFARGGLSTTYLFSQQPEVPPERKTPDRGEPKNQLMNKQKCYAVLHYF